MSYPQPSVIHDVSARAGASVAVSGMRPSNGKGVIGGFAGDTQRLLTETRDVTFANAVVNHPDVLPGLSLGICDSIDLSDLVSLNRNHLLMGEHGGAIVLWSAPGVYDVHDFVLPEGRGRWARDAAQDVFAFAFETLGARLLWTQTPAENRASRMFNRILGFRSEGVHPVVLMPGADPRPMEYFVMENG